MEPPSAVRCISALNCPADHPWKKQAATRSPTLNFVTAGPTATTSPAPSDKRYPPLDRVAIVLPAKDNQVAIVERSRFDPDHNLEIARFRQRPINKLQTFRSTVLLNFVASHWRKLSVSVVSCQRQCQALKPMYPGKERWGANNSVLLAESLRNCPTDTGNSPLRPIAWNPWRNERQQVSEPASPKEKPQNSGAEREVENDSRERRPVRRPRGERGNKNPTR